MVHKKRNAIVPPATSNVLEMKRALKIQQTLSTLLNEGKGTEKIKVKVYLGLSGISIKSFTKKELRKQNFSKCAA